jgi:hypothetical protein
MLQISEKLAPYEYVRIRRKEREREGKRKEERGKEGKKKEGIGGVFCSNTWHHL